MLREDPCEQKTLARVVVSGRGSCGPSDSALRRQARQVREWRLTSVP